VTQSRKRSLLGSPRARAVVRQWLPPIVSDGIGRLRRRPGTQEGSPDWEYRPSGWPTDGETRGWDVTSVRDSQLTAWPAFARAVEGSSPLGNVPMTTGDATYVDIGAHNTIMSFAYVAALASRHLDRISMLDWGGGLGQYGLLARSLLPGIEVEYHCRELPTLAGAGRLVHPSGTFHDTDDGALARTYDLVMASASLHYAADWRRTLASLVSVSSPYLYVTRLPVVRTVPSYVVVQRPYRYGYDTEYPGWFVNRGEFLGAAAELGLSLLREFLVWETPNVRGAPEQAQYRGYLLVTRRGTDLT
jgi:putative methyltransferase (TIGR04325 family)